MDCIGENGQDVDDKSRGAEIEWKKGISENFLLKMMTQKLEKMSDGRCQTFSRALVDF